MTEQIAGELAKPKWRGVLHQAAFVIAVGLAPLLIVTADGGRAQFAAAVFAGSVIVCFGASALYHRVTWKPRARLWMRRIDHAGVYLLIAGTYTPISLLVLGGAWRPVVLTIIWAGAAAAIVFSSSGSGPRSGLLRQSESPSAGAVVVLPQLIGRVDLAALILLVAGGLAYTLGAVVYVLPPGPCAAVFGYHELFHALTIVGVGCQYVAIAFFIVRAG